MAFQAVQVTKEDKANDDIVIMTSKTEYIFTPERQDMVYTQYQTDINYPACACD